MDLESILQAHVLPHWPLAFMSFALGVVGQFFKKRVWTLDRAVKRGKFWAFMHETLGLHAPMMGALLGALGVPASPGVDGPVACALYHFVSGAMAGWTVAAFKHFMTSRGIVLAESMAPPPNPSLIPIPPVPPSGDDHGGDQGDRM
jgi:hypothetical protein